MTYHACIFAVELAPSQRGEDDLCDCCDYHEGVDGQASVSAAVGAVGYDEDEYKGDGVGRHCHEVGARGGLVGRID